MNAERIMIKKWKKNIYGFLVILLAQSIGVALADMLLKEFVEQAFVRQVIAFVIVGIFAAADASFVFNRIFLLRRLLDKTPVRCRLEDIFLMPDKDDKNNVKIAVKIVYNKEAVKRKHSEMSEKELEEYLWSKIKDINKTLPMYKYIKHITITDEPLIKTTTNKIKRKEELDKILEKEVTCG